MSALRFLQSEFQQVHEGNLGHIDTLIAYVDGLDDQQSKELIEAREQMARLLLMSGKEFQFALDGLRVLLNSAQEHPGESPVSSETPAPGQSLYEKLGGGPAIKAAVDYFYERVKGDPLLAPLFVGVDMGHLRRHQALFLSQVLGGPKEYDGRDMAQAHQHLPISEAHFDKVAGHLSDTLTELGIDQEDIGLVLGKVAALKPEIVSVQGNGGGQPAPSGPETGAAPPAAPPPNEEEEEAEDLTSDIDPELYIEFVEDAMAHLEAIEINFLNLETDPGNRKIIDDIFRPFHTIKGVAGFLGLGEISSVCHATENLLDEARKGELEITGSISDLVLEIVDFLKSTLQVVRSEAFPHQALKQFKYDSERMVARLHAVREQSASPRPDTQPPEAPGTDPNRPLGEILVDAQVISEDNLEAAMESQKEKGGQLGEILIKEQHVKPVEIAHALRDQQSGKPMEAAADAGAAAATDSIRVRVQLLDKLMGLAGELVLGRNQLLQKLDTVGDEVHGLNSLLHTMDRITSEVQEAVMQTRMQPLSGLFSRFHRIVRDLARSLNKKIELSVEGETVELDKTLIEALADPLTHLIRNCADHGIEMPEQREPKGKPLTGRISLKAYHEGGRVYVTISDDGAGIDPEKVKAKAIEKGLVAQERAAQMTEREAMRLLFMPGFSTAEEITGVSGRGVGMDVVISNIQNVGGTVEIDSEPGRGTTFVLALPLTLAIVPALIVSAGPQRFAIPQTNLLELVYLEGEEAQNAILNVRGSEIYRLRGEMLPLVRLNRVLNFAGEPVETIENSDHLSIVVMAAGVHQFGMVVDKVYDTEEIVVQPLSNLLKDVGVFAGATLMGDGKPALILDIAGVMKTAELSVSEDSFGAGLKDASETAETHNAEEDQTLLVFNINPAERMAVPLILISRLETVKASEIRTSIHGKVIPYRDQLLPLIFLEDHSSISAPPLDRDTVKILVFEIENPVGLVVTEIIDSLEVPVRLDESAITPKGFTGLAMVQNQPTAFLDIYQVIEMAFPEWFQQQRANREKTRKKDQVTLLLAEDSNFYRNMEKSYLTQEGYNVLEADNGRKALDILIHEPVDLVVTDIEMPEMDGFELTRQIRANDRFKHLPVIAVTSLSQDSERKKGMDAGLDAYLVKLKREILLKEVHRLLNEQERLV